jgi:hypothetical protein
MNECEKEVSQNKKKSSLIAPKRLSNIIPNTARVSISFMEDSKTTHFLDEAPTD